MTTIATDRTDLLLPHDLLDAIDDRTTGYDHDNSFCTEDVEDLRRTGYLDAAVPQDLGGHGLTLAEVSTLQQRLAYVAPATALAVNMHLYWTGVAADLHRAGDQSASFILEQAVAGQTLAALHGERGNEMAVLDSTATATRVDGGWDITGHKIFGSLSPVWDWGGFHAVDRSDPEHPMIVHGFVNRGDEGVEIIETWDTLGMRATQSHDTVLDGVRVPDEQVVAVSPVGFAGAGPFHLSIFAWALLGFASVYQGAARRAFDITVAAVPERTSLALTRSMAHHPEVQHLVAEMRGQLDTNQALLDRNAADWSAGVDHADWPIRLLVARHEVIGGAHQVVDLALDAYGGGAVFRRSRLEQIYRDVRMGRFHPGNKLMFHEVVGKLCLGLDPDDTVRWG